jgi:hypothetical protein
MTDGPPPDRSARLRAAAGRWAGPAVLAAGGALLAVALVSGGGDDGGTDDAAEVIATRAATASEAASGSPSPATVSTPSATPPSVPIPATPSPAPRPVATAAPTPPPDVPPEGQITWEAAVELIHACQVAAVFQAHSLAVTLTLKDEDLVTTIEPAIDAVLAEVQAAAPICGPVTMATE